MVLIQFHAEMGAALLNKCMKVAVVTPTVATSHLKKCVESVESQTYKEVQHYVFVDGSEFFAKAKRVIPKSAKKVLLENNTGREGWLGHRVYAAAPFLVDADILCYLDEDNWIEPNHISALVSQVETGRDWAFSLRKIYSQGGDYLFEDNCESLGKWPVFTSPNVYHIDTSSYAVPLATARQASNSWYRKWDADRSFFHFLKMHFPNFGCTGIYSLCYRLGGNSNSVKKEFFEIGNRDYSSKFSSFPWRKK